jgi:hypothetical protein
MIFRENVSSHEHVDPNLEVCFCHLHKQAQNRTDPLSLQVADYALASFKLMFGEDHCYQVNMKKRLVSVDGKIIGARALRCVGSLLRRRTMMKLKRKTRAKIANLRKASIPTRSATTIT